MKYRKKPVVIDAFRWKADRNSETADQRLLIWASSLHRADLLGPLPFRWDEEQLFISTLEGEMAVAPGDWIIRGIQGEFYPCRPDIFAATYEAVES